MKIDGQCHCGRIRYAAEIDPDRVVICHCTDCQAFTGTAFRVTASARRDQLEIVGDPVVYTKRADSGRVRLQYFCPTCGSPLFSTGEGADADVWGIRWGGVRQRAALVPRRQIWRRSAPAWVCAFEAIPSHAQE